MEREMEVEIIVLRKMTGIQHIQQKSLYDTPYFCPLLSP